MFGAHKKVDTLKCKVRFTCMSPAGVTLECKYYASPHLVTQDVCFIRHLQNWFFKHFYENVVEIQNSFGWLTGCDVKVLQQIFKG